MNCKLFILLIFFTLPVYKISVAQTQITKKNKHPGGMQHAVALGPQLPLGNFSTTHSAGFSALYYWSNHRFGVMNIKPEKIIGFIAQTGIAYYFGKKEKTGGYPYRYPHLIFIHLNGGAIYNSWKKGNIIFTTGPALGLYNGQTQLNFGSNLEASYYLNKRIAITPNIQLMKEKRADALWAFGIKGVYNF